MEINQHSNFRAITEELKTQQAPWKRFLGIIVIVTCWMVFMVGIDPIKNKISSTATDFNE